MRNEEIKSIYNLIDSKGFRKRPGMYLGKKSISKLRTFMDGFYMCKQLFNIETADTLPPFWLFYNWICKEYKHSGSYYSWDGIILQNSNNDEELALETFFLKFDEFKEFEPTKILKSIINEEEIIFYNSHEGIRRIVKNGKETRIGPSDFLYIIKYNGNLGCSCHHHKNGKHINSDYFESIEKAKLNNEREYGNTLNWVEVEKNKLLETFKTIV